MQASIRIAKTPTTQYLLRIADSCLILGQRLGEWSGHAPMLEEDIALSNMALDLIGQARALLTHAGTLTAGDAGVHDEDQLAFLRDERDYYNPCLVELPRGDFAFTVLRNLAVATWLKLLWQRLADSTDPALAAIAGQAVKEARYHQRHAADWWLRLADGTTESRQRCAAALAGQWRYAAELFDSDAVDDAAQASGLGPRWADLHPAWAAELAPVMAAGGLPAPAWGRFRSAGSRGLHSEHMGPLLATLQSLQRSYPGGKW